jgi:hypothetical protein
MERNQLLNVIATILGFAAIGLPANMYVSEGGTTYLFWMISAFYSGKSEGDGLQLLFAGEEKPEFLAMGIPFYISFAVMATGTVLLLLTILPGSKLTLAKWLPAVPITPGLATYVITGLTMDIEGVLLEMFPIPIGMAAGIGAAVLSIIPLVPAK